MVSQELITYIDDRKKEGYSDDQIKAVLQGAGHPPADIEEAFGGPKKETTTIAQSSAPQGPVQAEPSMTSHAPEKKPGIPGLPKMAVLVGVVGVLIVGGAAFAYVRFVQNGPSPESIIANSIDKTFHNVHQMHIAEDLNVKAQIEQAGTIDSLNSGSPFSLAENLLAGSSTITVNAHFDGTFDLADQTNPKMDEKALVSLGSSAGDLALTFGGEIKIIDKKVYFEITDVPNLGFFDASPFKNKWIVVDVASSTPSILNVPSSSLTLGSADLNAIETAAQKIYKVTSTLPPAEMDGVATYHYGYMIDKQGLSGLFAALIAAEHQNVSAPMAKTQIDSFIANLPNIGGELWIGKDDGYMRGGNIQLTYATTTPSYSINAVIAATSTTSNINQPVTIDVPTDTESIEQVMAAAMTSLPAFTAKPPALPVPQTPQARDARRLVDLRITQNFLELYYNKCGYYPGAIASGTSCGKHVAISTWGTTTTGMMAALVGSNIGIAYPNADRIPQDPTPGATYYYGTNADGSGYIIAAKLEDPKNPVFSAGQQPSLSGFKVTGLTACKAPFYCLQL